MKLSYITMTRDIRVNQIASFLEPILRIEAATENYCLSMELTNLIYTLSPSEHYTLEVIYWHVQLFEYILCPLIELVGDKIERNWNCSRLFLKFLFSSN